MFFLLLIVAVVIVVIVLRKKKKESYKKSYTLVINEVLSLLEILQKFYKNIYDYCAWVTLIPSDRYGNLWISGVSKGSGRIMIKLLFCNFDENFINVIKTAANKTGTNMFFQLKEINDSTNYIAITKASFKGENFLPFLYNAIAKRFPKFKFNNEYNDYFIAIEEM